MLWEHGVLLICQIKQCFDGTNCHCDTTLFCINLSIMYVLPGKVVRDKYVTFLLLASC